MTGVEDLQQLTICVGGLVRMVSRCMVKHGDLIPKPWLSSGSACSLYKSLCLWDTQSRCSFCQERFLPKQGASFAVSVAFGHWAEKLPIRIWDLHLAGCLLLALGALQSVSFSSAAGADVPRELCFSCRQSGGPRMAASSGNLSVGTGSAGCWQGRTAEKALWVPALAADSAWL